MCDIRNLLYRENAKDVQLFHSFFLDEHKYKSVKQISNINISIQFILIETQAMNGHFSLFLIM